LYFIINYMYYNQHWLTIKYIYSPLFIQLLIIKFIVYLLHQFHTNSLTFKQPILILQNHINLATKNWSFNIWAACEKENTFFLNYFFRTSELHISEAFFQHQAHPILTMYEPMIKFCSKSIVSYFFVIF
jgi:hypothetical protein